MARVPGIHRIVRLVARRPSVQEADVWESLRQDFSFSLRGLRARPGFTAAAVLTLALGLGANTTMFGIVDRLLLSPPAHVRAPEQVVRVYFTTTSPVFGAHTSSVGNYARYSALKDASPELTGLAAFATSHVPLDAGPDAMRVKGGVVTGNFFEVLGVRPALGRFFVSGEDRVPRGEPIAVIGHDLWRSRFAGDTSIVGRTIRIGSGAFTVIGIASQGFTGVDLERVDVWLPISSAPEELFFVDWRNDAGSFWLRMVGRLGPDASVERTAAALTLAFRRLLLADPNRSQEAPSASVTLQRAVGARTSSGARTAEAQVALWLMGVTVAVLLIASANVATLLLARAAARRRDIAVRLALGIGRWRLVRHLLAEGLLLAALGGAGALLIAIWGGTLLRDTLLPDVAFAGSPLDRRVLAFTAIVTMATGLLATLVPALQSSALSLTTAMSEGSAQSAGKRSRTQIGLLAGQTALSLLLLVGAGLFVRSLNAVRGLDIGLDADRVLVVTVDAESAGYKGPAIHALFTEAWQRVRAIPGVTSASVVATAPLLGAWGGGLRLPGADSLPYLESEVYRESGTPYVFHVDGDFFATLGSRIVQGRPLTEADMRGPRAIVVNETLARVFWKGRSPIGECVYRGDDHVCTTVVGVVKDVRRFNVVEKPAMLFYEPLTYARGPDRALLVRTAGDADALAPRVRQLVQSLRPNLPYVSARSYAELIDPQFRSWQLGATMFTLFGALALTLAAVGLFGVLAYTVARRTREIGVRAALGAARSDIVRLVLVDVVRIVLVGLILGAFLALVGGRKIAPLLFQTSPTDPTIFALAALTLVAAAVLASLIPAWRAAHVDPRIALQADYR